MWVQVTDFDVHGLWVHPDMSGYCAANDEIACAHRGARDRADADLRHRHSDHAAVLASACRARNAQPSWASTRASTTLLMMSGGAGVGGIETLASAW